MKNPKTTNLRMWMFFKIVPAVLLFLYYWMCTLERYQLIFRYLHAVTIVLAGAIVLAQISYEKKQDIFDEFARENLKTTDSACLRVSFALMTVAALACVFADFSGIIAGYFVTGGIVLLAIIRAVMFTVIDKKGM